MTRTPLPGTPAVAGDCWNSIGVHGDRSCPELVEHVHCHNCPVFAAAGRRFLDTPSPPDYLREWTDRLAADVAHAATDLVSVLVFRLADEWLAFPVQALVEVTTTRAVHRVPHRAGLLAGLVNIRGELHLCIHFAKLLGVATNSAAELARVPQGVGTLTSSATLQSRLLVARRDAESWVFPVDAVDQVCRVSRRDLTRPPVTVTRAAAHLASGVFSWEGRPVGLLDDARLFETLRRKLR